MLKLKLITLFFALKNLIAPCHIEKKETGFRTAKNDYKIERTGNLPGAVCESSGIENAREGESFWTHGDGGTKNQLFEINERGEILSVLSLNHASNIDWEDMTKDDEGNLYIGDFGNNRNVRKNLRIYKINKSDNRTDTIHFSYPDQESFPPKQEEMNFDCESIFWYKNSLYLVSKNRGNKRVNFYKLPDSPGNYVAEIVIEKMYLNSPITSADISPDNQQLALLTYGKIYFFKVEEGERLNLNPYFCKTFSRSIQAEALVFINNTDLIISNEQRQLFVVKKKNKLH